MKPNIFVILPTYNRVETTLKFLECMQKQTYGYYRLIVVDDGSSDGTSSAIKLIMPEATILYGSGHLWWAGSVQKAIMYLKHIARPNTNDIVLIANDDTVFDDDFFEKAVKILSSNMRTLLLPKWKIENHKELIETGVRYNAKKFTFKYVAHGEEINLFTTMCLFMRWSDMVEIGDFHPLLLPHYNSDSEYTYRAHTKGFRLITRDDFWIIPDRTKTGFHRLEFRDMLLSKFIRVYFSRRSSSNPFCKISMILLTSPILYILPNIGKVLIIVAIDILVATVNSAENMGLKLLLLLKLRVKTPISEK